MMKRLLFYAVSLTFAVTFLPAYGSSHGDDEGMDSMEKSASDHDTEAMDGNKNQDSDDIENWPPPAAGMETGDRTDDGELKPEESWTSGDPEGENQDATDTQE